MALPPRAEASIRPRAHPGTMYRCVVSNVCPVYFSSPFTLPLSSESLSPYLALRTLSCTCQKIRCAAMVQLHFLLKCCFVLVCIGGR